MDAVAQEYARRAAQSEYDSEPALRELLATASRRAGTHMDAQLKVLRADPYWPAEASDALLDACASMIADPVAAQAASAPVLTESGTLVLRLLALEGRFAIYWNPGWLSRFPMLAGTWVRHWLGAPIALCIHQLH